MIGIFWIYRETVIGKAIDVANGEEVVPGIVDSPDNHADFWETNREYKRLFPELQFREYFDLPRGRVLYDRHEPQTIVYMDKILFNDRCKRLLREYFQLDEPAISWRTDSHYTTSAAEIDRLLK